MSERPCKICERLQDLWEHLQDPYWRLDHQAEVMIALTIITGVITGVLSLAFRVLTLKLERRYQYE